MFRNYLAAALRNLVRNRLYAAINILGLSVGITAALLIAIFVRDELSFDTWIPGYQNVYRLQFTQHAPKILPGVRDVVGDWTPPNLFNAVRLNVPEVQAMARLHPEERGLRAGAVESLDTVYWADGTVFDVLPFPALAGDLASALSAPDSAVLTRRMARKYFGRDDVLGATLELDRKTPLRVTAIIEDLPDRSHLNIGILASRSAGARPTMDLTYLTLRPGASAQSVAQSFPAMLDRILSFSGNNPFAGQKGSEVASLTLQPLAHVHMSAQLNPQMKVAKDALRPSGDPMLLQALAVVGTLILFMAVANFVNLMTARFAQRAVEVGVRKTSGAARFHLFIQFLGETALYVFLSLLIATILLQIAAPALATFLLRDSTFDINSDALLLVATVAASAVVVLLAGFYPALVLSSFLPATVMRRPEPAGGRGLLRQFLVIGQFAVLISLILATGVIARQTVFAMNEAFKADTDQLVFVETPCRDAFKDEVRRLAGVRGAACVDDSVLGDEGFQNFNVAPLADGSQIYNQPVGIDVGFLELSGFAPIAGHFFTSSEPAPAGATQQIVINETARRAFGFASAEAALGQNLPFFAKARATEVIGVVADFPISSMREKIMPMRFFVPNSFTHLVIKVDGAHIGETLRAVDDLWARSGAIRPIKRWFYDQHIQDLYLDLLRGIRLFTAFAIGAICIATLGLFGLAAFTAEQRTKEIGIRKAMGAGRLDILRLLLWQFTKPVLLANLLAWPVGYFVMHRWLEAFAYHIELSPWMFLVASVLALIIAIVTVAGHVLLVARAQPVAALRYE